MRNRRRRIIIEVKLALRFFYLSFIYALIFILINFYAMWCLIREIHHILPELLTLKVNFIISQLSVLGVLFVLLLTLMSALHRSLGPIPRMESILEKILQGDYSLRITIRKKDFLQSFVEKLNKVLDLLETKAKNKL
ncbi:MAG: hypothetical protein NC908_05595 [Candidatus Omnitrophica bacterium]|nr:hypothetical protein [Candidatus Omnitrophota bacterium]